MYFDKCKFAYEFRDYQLRVLNSLEEKLDDNKIHVVAAPGSGKTVLGLELVRRLDKTCLILVPSISIREQWIERFLELFVLEKDRNDWEAKISIDLYNPGIITCITYQALYAAFEAECIRKLSSVSCGCIVLDESHHLKREWWKAIESTVNELDNPTIISLTATPPYDSDNGEWARYKALCGGIDCEVLTPEMVKKNTLCPYQDHVYLTVPTQEEREQIKHQSQENIDNMQAILRGQALYGLMKNYDALINPDARLSLFLENPYILNAFIAYIRNYGLESAMYYEKDSQSADAVIAKWDEKLVRTAKESSKLVLDRRLFKILLECIIYGDAGHFEDSYLEQFKNELKTHKLLVRNKLCVEDESEARNKLISHSQSKMDAIRDIVYHEAKSLGNNLQMAILVDNVGGEELGRVGTGETSNKMNCVSVFEMLRNLEHLNNIDAYMKSYCAYVEELAGTRLGVLCGSFAIVPEDALCTMKMNGKSIGNTAYYRIEINDNDRREIVASVTKLLSEKKINVLVGTVSLLGEGWDAPGVNTVLIGSSISSFVMTNQMRGRGLRLNPREPKKTANIWHLATLETNENGDGIISEEYLKLIKRFDTILGMDNRGTQISNGIERIGLPSKVKDNLIFSKEELDEYIRRTFEYADNRELIRHQWQQLTRIDCGFDNVRDAAAISRRSLLNWKKTDGRMKAGELARLARGLHNNMQNAGLISGGSSVRIKNDRAYGRVCVYLENASVKDSKTFLHYYEQITGEIIAPRYILSRGFGPWKNYLAVPDYCKNKEMAISLMKDIAFNFSDIIYTRSKEGIKFLFELRVSRLGTDYATVERVRQIVIER